MTRQSYQDRRGGGQRQLLDFLGTNGAEVGSCCGIGGILRTVGQMFDFPVQLNQPGGLLEKLNLRIKPYATFLKTGLPAQVGPLVAIHALASGVDALCIQSLENIRSEMNQRLTNQKLAIAGGTAGIGLAFS